MWDLEIFMPQISFFNKTIYTNMKLKHLNPLKKTK